ncbi:unnamed protein product, partial [Ectocarpus sp. 13 AM-2016]
GYDNICPTIAPIDIEIQWTQITRESCRPMFRQGQMSLFGSGEAGMNCSKVHRCGVCIVCMYEHLCDAVERKRVSDAPHRRHLLPEPMSSSPQESMDEHIAIRSKSSRGEVSITIS